MLPYPVNQWDCPGHTVDNGVQCMVLPIYTEDYPGEGGGKGVDLTRVDLYGSPSPSFLDEKELIYLKSVMEAP